MNRPRHRLEELRAEHNVVAAVRDAQAARGAIEALERVGVDGSRIVLGGSGEPVAGGAPRGRAVARIGRHFLLGAVLGALAGGAVGWFTAIGGAAAPWLWSLFGALVGALVVAVWSFGVSRAWIHTFEAEHGGTLAVGVHTDDAEEAELAARTLESVSPLSLSRF